METLTNCCICKSILPTEPHITAKDYLVSGQLFYIIRCDSCGFLMTNPRPTYNSIGKYYHSEAYISHTDSRTNLQDVLYQLVKRYMLKRKLQVLKKHTPKQKSKLLDYGCGTGSFVETASKSGFNTVGYEPSEDAFLIAKQKGLNVLNNEQKLFSYATGEYDIITLWHVLEHVHDFRRILDKFYTLLNDKGILVIAVPMANSADALYYRELWAAYDLPRHLYHFTKDTLMHACALSGFSLQNTKALPFDSYYVALLSEKHQQAKLPVIKALYHGSVSNIKAWLNKSPWSSQIFIFKKS